MTTNPRERSADADPSEPISVGIAVWDGVELLDLAGPGQVFSVADEGRAFRVRTLGPSPDEVLSQGFLRIRPDGVLGEGEPPRILVVPGGSTEEVLRSEPFLDRLRAAAGGAELVFSVCTGALLLARIGLLDGLEATTWHGAFDRLRALAPDTRVVEGRRWIDNGRVITAAGVSAGIDASLHLVDRLLGGGEADRVRRYMEYPGGTGAGPDGSPEERE